MIGPKNSSGIAFGGGHRTGVIQQLAKFFDCVAHVRSQHVFTKKLVEHLADGTLQKRDTSRVTWTVPRVRSILCVIDQRAKERWRQAVGVRFGFTQDVSSHELRRVFKHMDEAVQFAQDRVRNVPRCSRFTVKKNRDIRVLKTDLCNKLPKVL